MPTARFHKLKTIKKRNFLQAAYAEFALHDYPSASISQLVATLKMAKGSIYQYFENKQELYNYLINHAHEQLTAVVNKACPLPQGTTGFNPWLQQLVMVQVKFLCAVPAYAMLFARYNTEQPGKAPKPDMSDKIAGVARAYHVQISHEHLYLIQHLPLLIFNYYIKQTGVDIAAIIKTGEPIDIPTNKLLYLCQSFLQKVN